jgi:hypothetical protein
MDLVVRRWNIEGDFSYVKARRQKMVGMIEAPTSAVGTNGHAAVVALCPLLGAERKRSARSEYFRV